MKKPAIAPPGKSARRNSPTTPRPKRPEPGRPRAFEDPHTRETLLSELRNHANVRIAAFKAGVARDTVYAEMERDPAFKAEVEEAREFALDMIDVTLFSTARSGDLGAICWIQKNRRPDEWQDRRRVEVGGIGSDGVPVAVTIGAAPEVE